MSAEAICQWVGMDGCAPCRVVARAAAAAAKRSACGKSGVADDCGGEGSAERVACRGGIHGFDRHGTCDESATGVGAYGTAVAERDDGSLEALVMETDCSGGGFGRSRSGEARELCRFCFVDD